MAPNVGELRQLKAPAFTNAIQQRAWPQALVATTQIFKTRQPLVGTDTYDSWITRSNRKPAKFNVRNGPSRNHRMKGGRHIVISLGYVHTHLDLDEWVLKFLNCPEDNKIERAVAWMLTKQAELDSSVDYLVEWCCWQALRGQISVDYSTDPECKLVLDAMYGFKPTHQANNTTVNWSSTSAKILSDKTDGWSKIRKLLAKDAGIGGKSEVFMNDVTNDYLLVNDEVKALVSDRTKDKYLLEDHRASIVAGDPVFTYEHEYLDPDTEVSTPFIADGLTYWLPPADMRDTFKILEGEVLVPAEGGAINNTPDTVVGKASWTETLKDPVTIRLHVKYAFIPLIEDPDAVVFRKVDGC